MSAKRMGRSPREAVVSVRLTAVEHGALRRLAEQAGAASVSEFIRRDVIGGRGRPLPPLAESSGMSVPGPFHGPFWKCPPGSVVDGSTLYVTVNEP